MSRLMEVRKIQYLLVIVLVKWRLIFLGILQVVRFEVWEVLVVVLNVGGGMLIISDSGSGEVWFVWAPSPPPSVPSLDFYFTREKTGRANFARLSLCIRGKLNTFFRDWRPHKPVPHRGPPPPPPPPPEYMCSSVYSQGSIFFCIFAFCPFIQ